MERREGASGIAAKGSSKGLSLIEQQLSQIDQRLSVVEKVLSLLVDHSALATRNPRSLIADQIAALAKLREETAAREKRRRKAAARPGKASTLTAAKRWIAERRNEPKPDSSKDKVRLRFQQDLGCEISPNLWDRAWKSEAPDEWKRPGQPRVV